MSIRDNGTKKTKQKSNGRATAYAPLFKPIRPTAARRTTEFPTPRKRATRSDRYPTDVWGIRANSTRTRESVTRNDGNTAPPKRSAWSATRPPTVRSYCFNRNGNDPTAGSPTVTLLRLLLRLNAAPKGTSQTLRRDARGAAAGSVRTFRRRARFVVATGGVYKGQGRNQRELMTRAYWGFLVHGE